MKTINREKAAISFICPECNKSNRQSFSEVDTEWHESDGAVLTNLVCCHCVAVFQMVLK